MYCKESYTHDSIMYYFLNTTLRSSLILYFWCEMKDFFLILNMVKLLSYIRIYFIRNINRVKYNKEINVTQGWITPSFFHIYIFFFHSIRFKECNHYSFWVRAVGPKNGKPTPQDPPTQTTSPRWASQLQLWWIKYKSPIC